MGNSGAELSAVSLLLVGKLEEVETCAITAMSFGVYYGSVNCSL